MKVLITAAWCASRGASEEYFGWSAVQCLAKDHELWVLTSGRNKPDLEQAERDGLVPENVRFAFLGGPFKPTHQNRLIARLQHWKEYYSFSANSLAVARKLHREVGFDLTHHVTVATWRVASPLWKLGIPFVFGPIGGGERFPLRYFPILSSQARAFETLRNLSTSVSTISPAVRASIRNASHVFAANPETFDLVKRMRGSNHGSSQLLPGLYSRKRADEFSQYAKIKTLDGPLRAFAGGYLEGRKGVALALHALARAKKNGLEFRYRIGGVGPEKAYLQQLSAKLALEHEVTFSDSLPGEAYRNELGATHIFLLPSLRESAGLTMMEAMLAGCVPIVADCGGPAHVVTNNCGYKISVSNPEESIRKLTETISTVDRDRQIILKKGLAASERIASQFAEENYRRAVNAVYARVTGM